MTVNCSNIKQELYAPLNGRERNEVLIMKEYFVTLNGIRFTSIEMFIKYINAIAITEVTEEDDIYYPCILWIDEDNKWRINSWTAIPTSTFKSGEYKSCDSVFEAYHYIYAVENYHRNKITVVSA